MLTLLGTMYDAALHAERWPSALQGFSEIVGGIGTVVIPIDPGSPPLTLSDSLEDANADYVRTWAKYDTRLIRAKHDNVHCGEYGVDAKHFSSTFVAKDPFFQDFLRPWGLGDCCYNVVDVGGGLATVAAQRRSSRGAFDEDEVALSRLLAPHLARAAALRLTLGQAEAERRSVESILDAADIGVLLLDENGRCLHANGFMRERIGDGLDIGPDREVRATDLGARSKLGRLLASACRLSDEVPPGSILLRRRHKRQPLHVEIVPFALDVDVGGTFAWGRAVAALVVRDPSGPPRNDARLRSLGLTAREAQVAALVGEGWSPRAISDQLSIAEGTVRIHLKVVFGKLDVRRQSELTALVNGLSKTS